MNVLHEEGGNGLPEGFEELGARVYAGDRTWIPEEGAALRAAFGSTNPWFAHGRAAAFCIPGLARAAAFHDPRARVAGRPAAFFGYWESVENDAAERALLAAVESWARARGARELYGPVHFSTAVAYRFLLSLEPGGLPFPGEPYNPPSYPRRMERLGLRLERRYLSQIVSPDQTGQTLERRRRGAARALGSGYRVEALRPEEWLERAPELHPVVEGTFGDNFAFTTLAYSTFEKILSVMVSRLCPETSLLAFAPGGEIAGLIVMYPHYGPLVVQGAGDDRVSVSELSYRTHAPLLARRPPVGWILKTIGVAPPHRRRGVMEALIVEALTRARGRYDYLIGALIREDNPSRRIAVGHERQRWYGLFAKSL